MPGSNVNWDTKAMLSTLVANAHDLENDIMAAARRHARGAFATVAMCVVDGRGCVRYVNAAARRLLDDGPLTLAPGGEWSGVLSARNTTDGQMLRRAIAAATDARRQPGAFALAHGGSATGWLQARVLPVGEDLADQSPGPDALVLLLLSTAPTPPSVPELQQLFGLTVAEAELARLLAQGMRLEDCACARNVSVATVRTQLTHVLDKTRCESQKSLVNILLSLPAPL